MRHTKSNILKAYEGDREIIRGADYGLPELDVFGRYINMRAVRSLAVHKHEDCIEICFLAKGQQTYIVGDRKYKLKGGDLFFTMPGEQHSSGDSPQEKGNLYWLILNLKSRKCDFLELSKNGSSALFDKLYSLKNRHFSCGNSNQFTTLLESIFVNAKKDFKGELPLNLSQSIITFLLLFIEAGADSSLKINNNVFTNVLSYIEKNISERITVPELASLTKLSVSHFKVEFKKLFGSPPAEYVIRNKIQEAVKRLKGKKSDVTGIAFDLGFSSSQYFATVFKRYTGKRPKDYLS
jgi:AraC-like DNA-binding protein/mannose-6-phosphate isomerase-like protein (cupin superfamily)